MNLSLASSQASQLRQYIYELNAVKSSLTALKGNLNSNWKGEEVSKINIAIDRINNKIQNCTTKLNNAANGITNAANQIRQEEIAAEEARRRAEEAARRRAAEQAEARRRVEQEAAAQRAAAEQARKAAEAEKKAMDELNKKINKIKNIAKRVCLQTIAKEPGMTSQKLAEAYKKIIGN
ncbi:MAG: hypothetical protein ACI4HZ_03290 [Ruminococcus sp.]